MTKFAITQIDHLGQPAVRITAEAPRDLRHARKLINEAGFWVLTTDDPAYALIAHPDAIRVLCSTLA